MAELPDLTVFARVPTRKYAGKKLRALEVTVPKKLNVSEADLKSALEGRELMGVRREGKTIQFDFSGGQILGLHLMLRGELVSPEDGDPLRFQILAFHFSDDEGFAVIDLQKQATPTLQPKPALAPDALDLKEPEFKSLAAKKRTHIKILLMDQKVVRGIGNSYADEILYHAGISPFSTARAIPEKAITKLFKSVKTVLEKAIEDIAEANGDELKGELRDFMAIHDPKRKMTSKGEEIKTDKVGGRTTYYTGSQELYQ